MRRKTIAALAATTLLSTLAGGAEFQFEAVIDADQAGTPSPATGLLTGVYDDVANTFTFEWTITDNLIGNPSSPGAHIHAAPAGSNGGVVFAMSGGAWPLSGNATWSGLSGANVNALFNGGLYANFHTSAFPGGEVRGQIFEVEPPVDCPGDTDGDGTVDSVDLNNLLGQFGCMAGCSADLDDDGDVDSGDLNILLGNFGETCDG